MGYRDHEPIKIDQFNGLWNRGDIENVPIDHFTSCNNIRFPGEASFRTRNGLGISQDVGVPLSNVKRIYNYPTFKGNTLIVLTYDDLTDIGTIYHVVNSTTVHGPILSIAGMKDFAFIPYAGRAYISPFATLREFTNNPESAMTGELVSSILMDVGAYSYAYTFVTAEGETSPSPLNSITTLAVLANPIIAPILSLSGVQGGNALVNGASYKILVTYSRDLTHETAAGPESNVVVNDTTKLLQFQMPSAIPADVTYVNVYRTVANGIVFFKLWPSFLKSSIPISGSLEFIEVSSVDDTVLATRTNPIANNTALRRVSLTNIGIGPSGTTSRKIYRTGSGGSQLKLLDTIANNTTVAYTDVLPDTSLGANAPTINTALVAGSKRVEKGLDNEFLYVYAGDGTVGRKAAGNPLAGTITIANGTGHTDAGFHIFAFVAETISGYLTAPGSMKSFTTSALNGVSFGTVPTGGATISKRHLVATRKVTGFNGDLSGYTFYFVPNATIENNTDTFLNNISFFDADLLDDASHLIDNYTEIPAGAVLSLYRNRLILAATFDNISVGLVSAEGEPEAISQIDGIIVVPPDGNAITNAQELRDILYVTKRSRTVSFNDNGDVPSSWPMVIIDNALGTSVHGIATVLDSGSSSVDFLVIATYQGISLFNGRYITPELSMKIESFWRSLNREQFKNIQMINAPIQKELYVILPTRNLLVGNYANGFDPKKIRWAPQSFRMGVNTIAINDIDDIIIGADVF